MLTLDEIPKYAVISDEDWREWDAFAEVMIEWIRSMAEQGK